MAGSSATAEHMRMTTPHTYNALQHLVMALQSAAKNIGKRTWLGRDKGVEAVNKLQDKLRDTVTAMMLDGLIEPKTSSGMVLMAIKNHLMMFSLAFPNWPDAYRFADLLFERDSENAVAMIERARQTRDGRN